MVELYSFIKRIGIMAAERREDSKDNDDNDSNIEEKCPQRQQRDMKLIMHELQHGESERKFRDTFREFIPPRDISKEAFEKAKSESIKLDTDYRSDKELPHEDLTRLKQNSIETITDFYVWLVQDVIDEKLKELRMQKRRQFNTTQPTQLRTIDWIKKLIQTPITDYRKHAANLILIPYLVVSRGMTDRNEIFNLVMQWADKCAELRRLDPSRREFSVRVRSRIDEVMKDRIPPMTLDTLKEKSGELYETLRVRGGE